jgi:CubicO group peptidase (beta-lactamase class C family)
MRILVAGGKLPSEPTRVLSEATVETFTTRVEGLPYSSTMGYGFGTGCPTARMHKCFGHDGSTGVMAWADKEKKVVFVVLNNRGHPDAGNGKIDAWKPKIADAIMEALGY